MKWFQIKPIYCMAWSGFLTCGCSGIVDKYGSRNAAESENCVNAPDEALQRGVHPDELFHIEYSLAATDSSTQERCEVPSGNPYGNFVGEYAPLEFVYALAAKIPLEIRERLQEQWAEVLSDTSLGQQFVQEGAALGLDFTSLKKMVSATQSRVVGKTYNQLQSFSFENNLRLFLQLLHDAGLRLKTAGPQKPDYRFIVKRTYYVSHAGSNKLFKIVSMDLRRSLAEQLGGPAHFQSLDQSLELVNGWPVTYQYYVRLDAARTLDHMADKLESLKQRGLADSEAHVRNNTLVSRQISGFEDPVWLELFKTELHRQFGLRLFSNDYQLAEQQDANRYRCNLEIFTFEQQVANFAEKHWKSWLNYIRQHGMSSGEVPVNATRTSPEVFMVEFMRAANADFPGISDYIVWEVRPEPHYGNRDYIFISFKEGEARQALLTAYNLYELSEQERRQEAIAAWDRLLNSARKGTELAMGKATNVGAWSVGTDPDAFLQMVQEQANQYSQGLGSNIELCWNSNRNVYLLRFNPLPDPSIFTSP